MYNYFIIFTQIINHVKNNEARTKITDIKSFGHIKVIEIIMSEINYENGHEINQIKSLKEKLTPK